MNKILSRIAKGLLGLSLACGIGITLASNKKDATRVDAGEAIYKTALFGSSYNSKGTNKYDQSWSATNNGFTVDLVYFSNNNNGWNYVKCGRSGVASTATITTHSAIDKAITKVALTIDALTKSKINSITLSTSSNGSSYTVVGTFDKSVGAKEVTISSPSTSLYYKITADCASGSSNGLLQISKVEYYYESDVSATSLSVGAISTYPGHTAEVSVTANPSGASLPTSLTYISENESVFTVSNDGIVTGVAAGSATLTVQNSSNTSVSGTATVTVNAYPSVSNRVTINGSNKYAIYATSNGSGSSLNYSLTGVTGNSTGVGTVSSGVSGDVNIDYKIDVISGAYANTVAFKTSSNKYFGYTSAIAASGNNYLHLVDSIDETSSWVVTSDQVILAKTYGQEKARQLRFNYNSGNPRFACYVATSSVSTYIPVSFYEIVSQSVTGISVNDTSLYPGHEKTLSVLPVPAQASLDGATYTFSSGTSSVATVDENGVVSALATGSSVITITASVGGNDYSTTATVTVQDYPAASGLTLNSSYVITGELESIEYELTGIDTDHNCGIATAVSGSYSKSLVIRPVEGYYTNTIAFEAVDGSGYLKSTKSSSNLTLATKLALNTSWVVSYSDSTFSVISAETYEEASQRHLLLNKNNTNGVANPRFGCYGGTSSSIVNINFLSAEVAATDFTLSESEVSIYKTQTYTLTVEFSPSNTTDRTLSWSSNNTSVATVNGYGVVTGVAPGTATITASKEIGGNTISRTCTVTVLNNVAAHAGTLGDPYSVNDAINVAQGFFTEDSHGNPVVSTGAYVKGIVTNLSYKTTTSISFWIGDNESQTSADNGGFEIYNPGTIMGKTVSERYTAVSQIEEDFAVGVTIVACGDITVYHSTSEFSAGSNVVFNNHIEAVDFAKGFNDAITDGVCESDGSTNQSELASAWLDQADNFDMLDDSTKALFLLIAENGNENGNDIEHAVATYDYILKKYNTQQVTTYIDFMGRVSNHIVTLPASSNYLLGSVITNNTDVIVILIATLTSISCLSAFILIKKRRAN